MEHKSCNCACCREAAAQNHGSFALFPGVLLSYLPDAAQEQAEGAEDYAMRLYHCRTGSVTFSFAAQPPVTLHAGELAIWREGSFLEAKMEPDEEFAGLILRVDLKKLTEQPPENLRGTDITGERLFDLYGTQKTLEPQKAEGDTAAAIGLLYDRPAETASVWRALAAQALLLSLGEKTAHEEPPEELGPCTTEQARLIREVHRELTQNLDKRVTIEELSKRYLMNPTTLKQAFKSVYGASLAAHMKEHRMGKAAQLLRETELPVAEIARMVGYESQSRLTAAFKEYFGLTPKEYRKGH